MSITLLRKLRYIHFIDPYYTPLDVKIFRHFTSKQIEYLKLQNILLYFIMVVKTRYFFYRVQHQTLKNKSKAELIEYFLEKNLEFKKLLVKFRVYEKIINDPIIYRKAYFQIIRALFLFTNEQLIFMIEA